MDRSSLTPHKRYESSVAKTAVALEALSIQKSQAVFDMSLIKDVEALKSHIRNLEAQNRCLLEEVEQARLDRSLIEAKLIKELGYKE